jgi:hypothetical protein
MLWIRLRRQRRPRLAAEFSNGTPAEGSLPSGRASLFWGTKGRSLAFVVDKGACRGGRTNELRGRPQGGRGLALAGRKPAQLTFETPGGKEPRSAAEVFLALETKFLLFRVGQEQDSVRSRSPAPSLNRLRLWARHALATSGEPPPPRDGTRAVQRNTSVAHPRVEA